MSDPLDAGLHSEVGPPEELMVGPRRVVLFDAHGEPLTRKVGF